MRLTFLAAALLAAGCGDGLADVSGSVTMDGAPLKDGEIIFEAPDNSVTPVGGKITDGKYAVRTIPGPKKVRIQASRPASKPDPVMGAAAREAAVAAEFNENTKLTAEIKPGRQADVNFAVKERPRPK